MLPRFRRLLPRSLSQLYWWLVRNKACMFPSLFSHLKVITVFPSKNCQRTPPLLVPWFPRPAVDSRVGPCARPQGCQGTKPEGEEFPLSRQEVRCQGPGGWKAVSLWAWVGATGQESFQTWELSGSRVGERWFLNSRGWHVPFCVVCNICNNLQFF